MNKKITSIASLYPPQGSYPQIIKISQKEVPRSNIDLYMKLYTVGIINFHPA